MKTRYLRNVDDGFTIVEMVASTALIGIMVFILMAMTQQASNTWRNGQTKVEQFRQARVAFEQMTRRISQATLNTHWDYQYDPADKKKELPPIAYVRQTRLRFRSGRMARLLPNGNGVYPTHGIFFQAPLGVVENGDYENLDRLLNTTGYYLEVSDNGTEIPSFLRANAPLKIRSKLMEVKVPSERFALYKLEPGVPNDTWIKDAIEGPTKSVRVLAENILALVIQPTLSQGEELVRAEQGKKALSPNFDYDSTLTSNHQPPVSPPDPEINPRHQLPPVVRLYMYAIDEESGQRLQALARNDPRLGLELDGLFQDASKLEGTDPAGDLVLFERQLQERHLKYRLFSTSVSLRGAKWSRSQTQ